MRRFFVALGIVGLVQLNSARVDARVAEELRYTKLQTFHAAHRFLRVDHGFTITEKDLDAGYLLFEYTAPGSDDKTSGSVEVIEHEEAVSLILQLPRMPEHHERYLVEGLLTKLRADYGEPPKAKERPPSDSEEETPKEDAPDGDAPKEPAAPDSSADDERVPGYRIK